MCLPSPTSARQRRPASTGSRVSPPSSAAPGCPTPRGPRCGSSGRTCRSVRSYKLRGAYNLIAQLEAAERAAGVVCASAGNHGQGVAYACRMLGMRGRVLRAPHHPAAEARADRRARRRRRRASSSTATRTTTRPRPPPSTPPARARRWCRRSTTRARSPARAPSASRSLDQLGRAPDVVVVPVGGGGLLAGVATLAARAAPRDPRGRGRAGGRGEHDGSAAPRERPVTLPELDTFVDGAAVRRVGRDHLRRWCATAARSWSPCRRARVCTEMLDLYQVDGIIAEPAGALASAALGDEVSVEPGSTVVCVLSGGNNDVSRYAEVVERSLVHRGLKHYFLVEFPQEPGALRRFLDEVLGAGRRHHAVRVRQAQQPRDGSCARRHRDQQPRGLRAAVGPDEGEPAEDPVGGAGEHRVPVPGLSLIFNLAVLERDFSVQLVPACLRDMERPPLDPLRVPLTELEDESGGRGGKCGRMPGLRARVTPRPGGVILPGSAASSTTA